MEATQTPVERGHGILLGTDPTELVKDLQETGLLEFARDAGVLPVKVEDTQGDDHHQGGSSAPALATPAATGTQQPQPMDTDDGARQQHQQHQQHQHHQHQHHQQQQQQQQQQAPIVPAVVPINWEVEAAVADAERALAQARGTVAVLAGLDQQQQASSRSTSHGHVAAGGDDAGTSTGATIGIVRRAARRGVPRGADQGYSSYGGYCSSGFGSGGGGYGSAAQQIGPLGFAPSERTGGKQGKGLRHFSMKVCEKVESKGTTTYNEVADELVAEMQDSQLEDGVVYDEKNIRRRVYDAINVLMALDVIAKEKKAIYWRGFNQGATSFGSGEGPGRPAVAPGAIARAQDARATAAAIVDKKGALLADLLEQQRALKALMARNALAGAPASGTQLELPFILVQAKPNATVEVQISDDMRDVQFDFMNAPFQIHDDSFVLRIMAEESSRQQATAAGAGAPAVAVAAAVANGGSGVQHAVNGAAPALMASHPQGPLVG